MLACSIRRGVVLVHGLAFVAATSFAWADDPPPLATIIQKVVAQDAANQKALRAMQYHETVKTERLDSHGQTSKRQEIRMIIRPGDRQEIQVLSEKGDDLPINPDQASLQARGKAAQKQNVNFSLKDMVGRFNVSFAGTEMFEGVPAYVIAFEPKANQPYRDQTEKVLNELHGRMWINPRDYNVLQTEATLLEPVEIAWIFAQINALDFHYVLKNTTGGMGPAQIQTTVEVDIPFIAQIHQRTTIDLTQFQPRSPK